MDSPRRVLDVDDVVDSSMETSRATPPRREADQAQLHPFLIRRSPDEWVPPWMFALCSRELLTAEEVVLWSRPFISPSYTLFMAAMFFESGVHLKISGFRPVIAETFRSGYPFIRSEDFPQSIEFAILERVVKDEQVPRVNPNFADSADVVNFIRWCATQEPLSRGLEIANLALAELAASVEDDPGRQNKVKSLGLLTIASIQAEAARLELDEKVAQARDEGATWAEIGQAAGINSSSAQRRWNADSKARHREYQRRRYS